MIISLHQQKVLIAEGAQSLLRTQQPREDMVSGSLPSTYLASEVRELGRVLAEAMEAQPLRDLGRPPAADDAVDAGPRVLVPALPTTIAPLSTVSE